MRGEGKKLAQEQCASDMWDGVKFTCSVWNEPRQEQWMFSQQRLANAKAGNR